MVPHETVWGMRQARSPAFWDVPIGVYRMTGDETIGCNLQRKLQPASCNFGRVRAGCVFFSRGFPAHGTLISLVWGS
jgi:hypothetical protein